ncbi:MAG: DUF4845 domain-containing protein [Steroidobacteraceae bacterium]
MRSRQTGVTFIGWLVLLAPLALVVFAAIRLTPVYLNYMAVAKAVDQLATESRGEGPVSPQQMRSALQGRFDVEGITNPEVKDIDIYREGDEWMIEADYTESKPLFGGISLQVHFDKRAVVR